MLRADRQGDSRIGVAATDQQQLGSILLVPFLQRSLAVLYDSIVSNLTGKARRDKLMGRDCVVAPVTLIVPGVLDGSQGPIVYTNEENQKSADRELWNGMPLTLGHPTDDRGMPLSGRRPDVLNRFGLGILLNVRNGDSLKGEAWFDVRSLQERAPDVLRRLESGTPIECSTGLRMDKIRLGKRTLAVNYRPDHLAVLPYSKGACSLEDGCGVLVNAAVGVWDRLKSLVESVTNAGFDPSQKRAKDGKWENEEEADDVGDGVIDFIHGTTSEYLDSIKEHGLVPEGGEGAHAFLVKIQGEDQTVVNQILRTGDRKMSVYLTTREYIAEQYAKMAAKVRGGNPILLGIDVPNSALARIKPDEQSDPNDHAYRIVGGVKPQWIIAARQVHNVVKKGTTRIYVVIPIIDDSVENAGFDPAQPRASDGEWTDTGAGSGGKLSNNPHDYFDFNHPKSKGARILKVKDLETSHDIAKSNKEAIRRMSEAAAGRMDKRKAILVQDLGNGKYKVLDGNSTTHAAREGGLEEVLAVVKPKPTPDNLAEYFKPEDVAGPDKTPHHNAQKTAEEVYATAAKDLEGFKRVLDHGSGLDKELGATLAGFDEAVEKTKNRIDKPLLIVAPLKGKVRAEEKVRNKYEGDWSRLTDVVRGTVVVEHLDDMPSVINTLNETAEKHGWEITDKSVESKFKNPTAAGYRDLSMLLDSPSGLKAELQINTRSMFLTKNTTGHKLYEEWRSIVERKDITPVERVKAEALAERMKGEYGKAFESDAGPAHNAESPTPWFYQEADGTLLSQLTPGHRFKIWQPKAGKWADYDSSSNVFDSAVPITGEKAAKIVAGKGSDSGDKDAGDGEESPPVDNAGFDPSQLRDAHGRWLKSDKDDEYKDILPDIMTEEQKQYIIRLFGTPKVVVPTKEEAKGVDIGALKPGHCFDSAGQYVLSHPGLKDIELHHGLVDTAKGYQIAHGWVTIGDKVFDGTKSQFYDRASYYSFAKAREEKVYTPVDMMKKVGETENWGPWHDTKGLTANESNELNLFPTLDTYSTTLDNTPITLGA